MLFMQGGLRGLVPCLMAGVLAGCSAKEDGRMDVYPASGKVVVAGQPAVGARVVLYGTTPELQGTGAIAPYGVADESGAFHLRSYDPDDGAPAGKFNATVFWPEAVPEGVDPEVKRPKDRLKGRYSNPDASGIVVEVPEGGGELAIIELK